MIVVRASAGNLLWKAPKVAVFFKDKISPYFLDMKLPSIRQRCNVWQRFIEFMVKFCQ